MKDIKKIVDRSIEKNCKSIIFYYIAYIQLFILLSSIILVIIALFVLISFINLIFSLVYAIIVGLFFLLFGRYEERLGEDTYQLIQKYPESQVGENLHAIIIVHKKLPKKSPYSPSDYTEGVDILIKKFRNNSMPQKYQIYDISLKTEFKEKIENCNATHIWIFGHGRRYGIKTIDGLLCYFELKNIGQIEFVGQYHCNSLLGSSLADYYHPKYQDVTRWPRFSFGIRISVKKKLNEMGI